MNRMNVSIACLSILIVMMTSPVPRDAIRTQLVQGAMQETRDSIELLLDGFHDAASSADGSRYFAYLSEDAVFLGTDATERWTKPQFHAFCKPYFDRAQGWTYTSTQRHVDLDPTGSFAWFDELLHNDKYGQCRGSGVVVKRDGRWQIAQYNLSMPVPNEMATGIVSMIRGEPFTPTTVYVVRHAERADDGSGVDPELSQAGSARAQQLSRLLGEAAIDAAYATGYKRTQRTVQPLAVSRGIEVTSYDSIPELAARITAAHSGGRVVVAGHSNTVGPVIRALGVQDPPRLSDDDYGDVFVVTIDAVGRATMQHLKMD